MPTIHKLAAIGAVHRVEITLGRREFAERFIFISEEVKEWLSQSLPLLERFYKDTDLAPDEQVVFLFHAFIVGKRLHHWRRLHVMTPVENGVWELKAPDIRFFGWFPEKDVFVAARVDSFARVKQFGLADGLREETIRFREALDLNEPKFIAGGDQGDVVSNAD